MTLLPVFGSFETALDSLAPMVATVAFMAVPITYILVKHQQKMTTLIRGMGAPAPAPDIQSLRQDVEALKSRVNEQTLLLDTIAGQQQQILSALEADNASVERRLNAP